MQVAGESYLRILTAKTRSDRTGRGRKVELAMFSFTAALLFAFASVRNAQPGTPPIGTYSDFISFFWAEVIIALCLMILVFTWVLRPAK